MPGVVKIRNNAGGVYESYVKWLPDEVLHMDYNSLMGMLLEMREFAHFCTDNYQLISSFYEQCTKIKENKEKKQSSFSKLAKVVVILVILMVAFLCIGAMASSYALISLFAVAFVSTIVLLPFLIVDAVGYIRAYAPFRKDYPMLLEQGRMAEENFHNALCTVRFVDYNSGLMVLPAYFTNAMALDFMCDMVRNQRALTLGQAVNLYERYMEEQRRIGLMKAQIAVQQKTASYAQSAAISSACAAANTFFRW